jgi:hypothetical protein
MTGSASLVNDVNTSSLGAETMAAKKTKRK